MKRSPRLAIVAVVAVVVLGLGALAIWRSIGGPPWTPTPSTTFQIKLTGVIDVTSPTDLGQGDSTYRGTPSAPPQAFLIPATTATPEIVHRLHRTGAHVICVVPVTNWSSDIIDPGSSAWAGLKGPSSGGQTFWLNTNPAGPLYNTLINLMTEEFQVCHDDGFDAVAPERLDETHIPGLQFDGVPITSAGFANYAFQLTEIAHSLGLSIAQTDDPADAKVFENYFDFAIVNNCFTLHNCAAYTPYTAAHRAVMEIETSAPPHAFCPAAIAAGRTAGRYNPKLNGNLRIPCT